MLSTCQSAETGAGRPRAGRRGADGGEESRRGPGVQEWPDGSRYEGESVDGFKHGEGKYTWRNGEFYEGSFYRDYRHGSGLYCWPTGHKFTGKFYLNRKEGYGQQLFPDGATFQGLYRSDQRFGPGVVTYPDGRQDVGVWLGERLLRLCTSVDEGFSLNAFADYAAFMDSAAITASLTQPPTSGPQAETGTYPEVDTDRDLLTDENFILPTGIESYSTDGDHLPLPPGRRRELDRLFHGDLWEADAHPHQGYERDPLSSLPLQARVQAHIHKNRLQADNVGWNVAAVLSLNREGFGLKGPLEVRSELLIQHASRGELQAVSQILQTGLVHPDVADSQGHTALIAATINCHNDVIQLLLDMGADIDKLNCEGMSALAVCHVLYYPFQCLHTTLVQPPAKTQVVTSPSARGNSPQISQVDVTTDPPLVNNRPQTSSSLLSNQNTQSYLSDQTAEELTEHILHEVSKDRELSTNTPADTEHLQEEERRHKGGEGGGKDGKDSEGEGTKEKSKKEGETESQCDQMQEDGERGGGEEEIEEGDVEKRVRDTPEDDAEETVERGREAVPGVEHSIQVLDGHIALGTVQWKQCRGIVQPGKDKAVTPKPVFDSARSVSSYSIQVTEEAMQRSAEALSHAGIPQHCDTQETVRKMAAMKIEHRVRLNTLKLLLERGADPNLSRVPMPVLFLAIMAADSEAVRRLLLSGARTDIPLPPERRGLYPLHVAAALPGPAGPRITELLLHAITDLDAQACDENEVFELDKEAQDPLSTNKIPHLKEGGRTALHVACQRDSDFQNASKVVALLLSHRANTDLLWSGHSPLSLAIARGNDLAVEELLNGGANPNIPLGRRVGSALCAFANINYHLGGNRVKLLDMLAEAGADILMPVMVGDVVGTAVDYAHYSFKQDVRIANTPFHALNMHERETFKARRQLLSMMGDLLRRTAGCERENLEREQHLTLNSSSSTDAISSNMPLPSSESVLTEEHRKQVLQFCYYCGRSVSVKLTACSRCRKVFYCSRTCKLKAWDERHKEECVRVSASADGIQKSVDFKSKRGPKPLTVMLKSKTPPRPLSVKLKSHRVSKTLSMAEKVLESQVNLKENYSCN